VTAEPALSPQAEKQAEKTGNMPAACMCFSANESPCPAGSPIVSQSWRNGSFAPIRFCQGGPDTAAVWRNRRFAPMVKKLENLIYHRIEL